MTFGPSISLHLHRLRETLPRLRVITVIVAGLAATAAAFEAWPRGPSTSSSLVTSFDDISVATSGHWSLLAPHRWSNAAEPLRGWCGHRALCLWTAASVAAAATAACRRVRPPGLSTPGDPSPSFPAAAADRVAALLSRAVSVVVALLGALLAAAAIGDGGAAATALPLTVLGTGRPPLFPCLPNASAPSLDGILLPLHCPCLPDRGLRWAFWPPHIDRVPAPCVHPSHHAAGASPPPLLTPEPTRAPGIEVERGGLKSPQAATGAGEPRILNYSLRRRTSLNCTFPLPPCFKTQEASWRASKASCCGRTPTPGGPTQSPRRRCCHYCAAGRPRPADPASPARHAVPSTPPCPRPLSPGGIAYCPPCGPFSASRAGRSTCFWPRSRRRASPHQSARATTVRTGGPYFIKGRGALH